MYGGADLTSFEAAGNLPTKYSGNVQVRVESSCVSTGVLARVVDI